MSLNTLSDVLGPAYRGDYAVAGLVVLGWEDARAFVEAAEAEGAPVILQAGPGCRAHTPLPILAAMFRTLADDAAVPVVAHLDHGYSREECVAAIDAGFTSVMFDGSRKPLQQNIEETAAIVELARSAGVSSEGEIGFVGYAAGEGSAATDPEEARLFAEATQVDAMAVSVGNVHLKESADVTIDFAAIRAIEAVTRVPLVIHGASGVPPETRTALARTTAVCKFNIGTELRKCFGTALREAVNRDPARFDRNAILSETTAPVRQAARNAIRAIAAVRETGAESAGCEGVDTKSTHGERTAHSHAGKSA